MAEEHDRLRGGLRAVGALLGFEIVATDDEEWRLDDDGLRVGLGWYGARGHGEREALALATLQLWEGPREALVAPARARRRRTLERRQPEAEPLIAAVARLQACAELLAAMPGLRVPLGSAVLRGLPGDPSTLPRHLQWVWLLLRGGEANDEAHDAALDPLVRAEWDGLAELGGADVDALRRALAPDPAWPPLRRFERALALLLPPYERLLRADLAERGWGAGRSSADGAGESDAPAAPGPGSDAGTEPGADAQGEREGDAGDESPGEGSEERARRGEGRQTAEGSDLFAAQQAGFTSRVLPTPLPGDGALAAALVELAQEAGRARTGEAREAAAPGGSGGGASGPTPLADYRRRAAELADPIERVRRLWQRVIAERVALRGGFSREALPEGEVLAVSALAGAVAEAAAGIPRPRAFHRRIERPRRARGVGSTDYVLLVDRSASMRGPLAEAAADAMLVLMESLAGVDRDIAHGEARAGIGLDLDVRSALIVFEGEPEVVKPLSHGMDDGVRRAVHAAIRDPRAPRTTARPCGARPSSWGWRPATTSTPAATPPTGSDGGAS